MFFIFTDRFSHSIDKIHLRKGRTKVMLPRIHGKKKSSTSSMRLDKQQSFLHLCHSLSVSCKNEKSATISTSEHTRADTLTVCSEMVQYNPESGSGDLMSNTHTHIPAESYTQINSRDSEHRASERTAAFV